MKTGIVIKSVGSRYKVLCNPDDTVECTLKGKLRVKELQTTNPVAVGDNVRIEFTDDRKSGVITEVLERRNYILRRASNLSRQFQIIAANIDQVLLVVTIILPKTPVEFIDRFLVTAEAYRIPVKLIFNKTDLYSVEENNRMEHLIDLYSEIGYECLRLSATQGINISKLKDLMKDRISVVSGNSGVGKSTLLNLLDPSLKLRTDEISGYHKQGKHITTFPEMFQLPFGGFAIDTPGLRGFGVADMEKGEIYHFFPEIFRIARDCRFHNCLHLDEPGCAVRSAVEDGKINTLRYKSYISIMNDDNSKYR